MNFIYVFSFIHFIQYFKLRGWGISKVVLGFWNFADHFLGVGGLEVILQTCAPKYVVHVEQTCQAGSEDPPPFPLLLPCTFKCEYCTFLTIVLVDFRSTFFFCDETENILGSPLVYMCVLQTQGLFRHHMGLQHQIFWRTHKMRFEYFK